MAEEEYVLVPIGLGEDIAWLVSHGWEVTISKGSDEALDYAVLADQDGVFISFEYPDATYEFTAGAVSMETWGGLSDARLITREEMRTIAKGKMYE